MESRKIFRSVGRGWLARLFPRTVFRPLREDFDPPAGLWRHSLHILIDAVVYNLPRGPIFDLGNCVKSCARGGADRYRQFWVIANEFRFSALAETGGWPSHPFFGFRFHGSIVQHYRHFLLEKTT